MWNKVKKELKAENERRLKTKNKLIELYVDLILTLIFILSVSLYFDVEGILK